MRPQAWPDELPQPPLAAALILLVIGFGVLVGAATERRAQASPQGRKIVIVLPAAPVPTATATPAPAPVPTPPARPSEPVTPSVPSTPAPQAPAPTATAQPTATAEPTATPVPADPTPPDVKHVYVLWLAGQTYDDIWGPTSAAPYLAQELRPQGALLTRYHAIGHGSLANAIALLSGQAPNDNTAADCTTYSRFAGHDPRRSDGQAVGKGCVFGPAVPTLPSRMGEFNRTWRAYAEGIPAPCAHPQIGAADPAPAPGAFATARVAPLYFGAITDAQDCAQRVVGLDSLAADVADAKTAPELSLIAPTPCDAGVPGTCPAGEPDGLARADSFLRAQVPAILDSPAYRDGGLLLVVFDQGPATGPKADFESCCDQPHGPNEAEQLDPTVPSGGGRTGLLAVSDFIRPGTTAKRPYNHYALLRTLSNIFGVEAPGYAAQEGLRPFGADVFNKP